ncbi:hypothetical protein AAGG74_18100 [Bacillus mexicanus]|uniref:hypothetical protein n=1 Tax=Bacillus mexicanus TaxID=2834415 RepID=UPI003D1A215B
MDKEQIIKEVLFRCQQHGKTYIVGGYIRNKLLGYEFNDVDLLTSCSLEKLKEIFPKVNWTDQGLTLGICRMQYKGIQFDFSSCTESEFEDKLKDRDFTINSFYFDGHTLIAQSTASKDLYLRILRPMRNIWETLNFSPHSMVRAFRFISCYNLNWSEDLLNDLKESSSYFEKISEGRLQKEAYEILKGKHIIKALYYYESIGLISPNPNLKKMKDLIIPTYNQNISARLIYLSYLLGKGTIIEFIQLHHLSNKLIEEIQEYLPYLKTDKLMIHPRKLPFLILLKRYQFQDDKTKIKEFLGKHKQK